jgi:hypothetical protein
MVERVYRAYQPRDWSVVAADYEEICLADLALLST